MDVTNAVDTGQRGTPDVEQLDYATGQGRVLFSYNIGDFFAIHTRLLEVGRSHAGMILAPQQRFSVGEQMRRILLMSRQRTSAGMRGRVEFLSRWGEARSGSTS
jgi:hypothetical protein